MPPVRRAAAPPPPPKSGGSVDFGASSFYAGGFDLPPGQYALEFTLALVQRTNAAGQQVGAPSLRAVINAYPLQGGPAHQFSIGLGGKAHESFMPSEDGKGLEPVPGGPSVSVTDKSNWALFRKSMLDCGMPEGVLTNDLSVIDGTWVQTDLVPEPEERKGFRSGGATGESAMQQQEGQRASGSGKIPIVVEILEGGKPWEGTGGLPAEEGQALIEAAPAPKASVRRTPTAVAPAARPASPAAAARPAARRAAAPPPPAQEVAELSDEVKTAAINGMSVVLEKNPAGCTRVQLRTGTFSAISGSEGQEMANEVLNTVFGDDETLGLILGELGYALQGAGLAARIVAQS